MHTCEHMTPSEFTAWVTAAPVGEHIIYASSPLPSTVKEGYEQDKAFAAVKAEARWASELGLVILTQPRIRIGDDTIRKYRATKRG